MKLLRAAGHAGHRTREVRNRRGALVAAIGCVMALLATTPACELTAEGDFSMLSYNVAGLPQEVSTENPEEHIPMISPLLEPYDIVVTQEDFDWWVPALDTLDFAHYHERLRAEVTHSYQSPRHPGPEAVGIDGSDPERPMPYVGDGLGFLSRFPTTNLVRQPWTHCFGGVGDDGGAADCLAMKGFGVATMTLAPGVLVDVYTLHAEAGGTQADDRMRAEDFELLSAFMDSHTSQRAVIVAGDMNLHTQGHPDAPIDGPIWDAFLAEQNLTDVCDVVTCEAPGSIDKFAFRAGGGVTLHPQQLRWEDDIFVGPEGEDLSDHPPVAVDWHWMKWE